MVTASGDAVSIALVGSNRLFRSSSPELQGRLDAVAGVVLGGGCDLRGSLYTSRADARRSSRSRLQLTHRASPARTQDALHPAARFGAAARWPHRPFPRRRASNSLAHSACANFASSRTASSYWARASSVLPRLESAVARS